MLIAQGHIISPINYVLAISGYGAETLACESYQVDLDEEPPVGETIGAGVTRLAEHEVYDSW